MCPKTVRVTNSTKRNITIYNKVAKHNKIALIINILVYYTKLNIHIVDTEVPLYDFRVMHSCSVI